MKRRNGLSFYRRRKRISSEVFWEIIHWIVGIISAILIAAVLVFLVGMTTSVIGVSMEPCLYNGQKIFINRFIYNISTPKVSDVVVFLPNGNENAHYYVKRIVACPGDTVQIKDGKLYVNSEIVSDDYDKIADAGIVENELTLEEDEYFVVGDNINNSEDSRSANIGPIKKEYIIGKAWFHMAGGEDSIGFIK